MSVTIKNRNNNLNLLFCFTFILTLFSEQCKAASIVVGQWDRFEISVKNTKDYRDPYSDVTLKVMYEDPRGGKTAFWGFYDGAGTWKIRFMPYRIGTWKYAAVFSDGSQRISGTFECVRSKIPGMISVDETSPVWFGYKGGKHVLIRSFHVGAIASLPRTGRQPNVRPFWTGLRGRITTCYP